MAITPGTRDGRVPIAQAAQASRLAIAAITGALILAACGTTTPTPRPSTGQAPSPSASPVNALHIDDAAYLGGDTFKVSVGDPGTDWTAPSPAPLMPNGQPAVRVAFLPASCSRGDLKVTADAAPQDPWETQLAADGDKHHYTLGLWPAAQGPECAGGHTETYLQVAYHPIAPLGKIHLVASVTNENTDPKTVDVVPVFTSADATQPSLTAVGSISLAPVSGPSKPRSATAKQLAAETFAVAILPDGSAPTLWGFKVTGCGPVGTKPIVITAKVGSAKPVTVGHCSDGGFASNEMSLPRPPDGTHITLYIAGGTTKSQLRITEFQWRGDRP